MHIVDVAGVFSLNEALACCRPRSWANTQLMPLKWSVKDTLIALPEPLKSTTSTPCLINFGFRICSVAITSPSRGIEDSMVLQTTEQMEAARRQGYVGLLCVQSVEL